MQGPFHRRVLGLPEQPGGRQQEPVTSGQLSEVFHLQLPLVHTPAHAPAFCLLALMFMTSSIQCSSSLFDLIDKAWSGSPMIQVRSSSFCKYFVNMTSLLQTKQRSSSSQKRARELLCEGRASIATGSGQTAAAPTSLRKDATICTLPTTVPGVTGHLLYFPSVYPLLSKSCPCQEPLHRTPRGLLPVKHPTWPRP